MNINAMTRKQLESIPLRQGDEDIGPFDSLIILPRRTLHDSGFRTTSYIALRKNKPICRLSGSSDALHINGITGSGPLPYINTNQQSPAGWTIDCLTKSGLLRLFCRHQLIAGDDLSSFEIFSQPGPSTITKLDQ